MKRLLILLALTLAVMPVAGLSLTFQDSSEFGAYVTCSDATCAWTQSATGGNNYIYVSEGGYSSSAFRTLDPSPTTYAAITELPSCTCGGFGGRNVLIILYNSAGGVLTSFARPSSPGSRWEVKMVGGVAQLYKNDVLQTSSGVLAQNPSYIAFGTYYGGSSGYCNCYDDLVYGTSENRYITGSPEQGYYLLKDPLNPAANGFYKADGTLISSYNMTTTWGIGDTHVSQTVVLKEWSSANNAWTYTTTAGTMAGTIAWPLQEAIFNNPDAPYGYYITTIPGSGFYSSVIPYWGGGGGLAWSADTYARPGTGTVDYTIDAGYWDPTTYSYRIDVIEYLTGATHSSQTVAAQTGTKSVTFTDDDDLGVYYAVLKRTPLAGGREVWMWGDTTELTGYLVFTGNVFNGETAAYLPVANVSIRQGSTAYNKVTAVNGNYTTNAAFYSGALTHVNITAPGYIQYRNSFTADSSGTKSLNFTLYPINPTISGLALCGVVRDDVYGRPISTSMIEAYNSTYSDSRIVYSNSVGGYLFDDTHGTGSAFTNGRCYYLTSTKLGYTHKSPLGMQCVWGV